MMWGLLPSCYDTAPRPRPRSEGNHRRLVQRTPTVGSLGKVSHLTSPCDLRHFMPGRNWPRIEPSFGTWWMFQPQRNSIRDGETWGKS